MNLPDHINPVAVDDALLNIGMTINEIRELTGDTGDTDPQIIRTVEELESHHPDTVVWPARHYGPYAVGAIVPDPFDPDWTPPLPAVVVRDGAQVRAARKALEEA